MTPRVSLSLKRWLLNLNRDRDAVVRQVCFNDENYFLIEHTLPSHAIASSTLGIPILYLEDRRFFSHSGIEFRSLLRGFKRLVTRGSLGGVSTIDQQVVRISLNRYERTIMRKLRELIISFSINTSLSKNSILSYYIYNAYLGYKISGCAVAARTLFRVGESCLDREQAAFIAALFPLPIPRAVLDAYKTHHLYPMRPHELISFSKDIAPKWAERIHSRMAIAMRGYDASPNNL